MKSAKVNSLLLIEKLNSEYGLNLEIKPFIEGSITYKRLFNGLDYLFYSQTWEGLFNQLFAFAEGVKLAKSLPPQKQTCKNNIPLYNGEQLQEIQDVLLNERK